MINTRELRAGRGSVQGLGRELGKFIVVTMPDPWKQLSPLLGHDPAAVYYVSSSDVEELDRLVADHEKAEFVIGAGGGVAVDAAKYLSWKSGTKLVTIPTVISVDAFVTNQIAVRRDSHVSYVGDARADMLIVDFDLIRTAPRHLNIAGIGDILSCHTASFDWRLACEQGITAHPVDELTLRQARRAVEHMSDHVGDIRQVNDRGLKLVVDTIIDLVEACQLLGHARAEEGSEHFVFYHLELLTGRGYPHGPVVALGIDIMSELQQNEPEWIRSIMADAGIDGSPRALGISKAELRSTLVGLEDFVKAEGLWYSIINSRGVPTEFVDRTIDRLQF